MFAVDHRLAAGCLTTASTDCAHAVEVLLVGDAERDAHVIVPGLGDEADGVGVGLAGRLEPRIVGDRAAGPLGHAEGGEARRVL